LFLLKAARSNVGGATTPKPPQRRERFITIPKNVYRVRYALVFAGTMFTGLKTERIRYRIVFAHPAVNALRLVLRGLCRELLH